MANIDNLKPDFSGLSDEELLDIVKGARQSRRERPKTRKASNKKPTLTPEQELQQLMSALSPEQIAALIGKTS